MAHGESCCKQRGRKKGTKAPLFHSSSIASEHVRRVACSDRHRIGRGPEPRALAMSIAPLFAFLLSFLIIFHTLLMFKCLILT